MSPFDSSSHTPTAPSQPVDPDDSEQVTACLGGTPAVPPTTTFGRYQTFERIGRGGLGDVFRARHLDTGEEVALKLMRGEDSQSAVHRSFEREVEAARRLAHPGILPILAVGKFLGSPYYVMPLVRGGSVEARLRRGPVEVRWAVTLVARVARALEHAHQNDVLHRDLKPANILLVDDDSPLVADFGLARFADHTSCSTQTGQFLGSFPYMSPEQAAGRSHKSSPRTDVWAMGVVLYEMLAGRRPFRGANQLETVQLILHDDPPALRPIRGDITADLEALCLRCLEKVPQDRPASAARLADDLEAWLRAEPIPEPSRVAASLRRAVRKAGPRRVRMMSLGGLSLAVGLVFLLVNGPRVASETPEAPVRHPIFDLLGRAKPGKPVSLIDDGRPVFGRFALGGAWSTPNFGKGTAPWIGTHNECLFELLPPDPRRKPYRLHLRIKQTRGTADSAVGIFAGRYVRPTATETAHFVYRAWYREPVFENAAALPPGPRRGDPQLQFGFLRLIQDGRDEVLDPSATEFGVVSLSTPADPARSSLPRHLTLEMGRVNAIVRNLGGRSATIRPREAPFIRFAGELHCADLRGHVTMPDPTGGAGILLRNASVDILAATYEPLPEGT